MQDYSRLYSSYRDIIMDDANLTNLSLNENLSVMDTNANKTWRIVFFLYGTASKGEYLVQMGTMNIPVF